MSIRCHPSKQQILNEELRKPDPHIQYICKLRTQWQEVSDKLRLINERIEAIKASTLPQPIVLSQITQFTKDYPKSQRDIYKLTEQETKRQFWQHAVSFWIYRKAERTDLLNALCPLTMEARIQFKAQLKAFLPSSQPMFLEPRDPLFTIEEDTIQEKNVRHRSTTTEAVEPSQAKKHKPLIQ